MEDGVMDASLLNPETILFDGVMYPCKAVLYQNLGRFENRIVTGDPSKDNDELASTKVLSDFSGGIGVLNEKEGADVGRFWFGVGLETSRPDQLSLVHKVYSWSGWRHYGASAGRHQRQVLCGSRP